MRNTNYLNWSKEDLVEEIQQIKKMKKYGIVWDEKHTKEKFDKRSDKKLPILKEIKIKEIKVNKNSLTNILIEGDNYHALSVLNYTHRGKIDAIYIDPPYNTGNNTWKYNNKFVDENDAYKHSKWINFMNKRLQLAKPLLKKNGIICVTIDNYEIHNLRHIIEDVFSNKEIIITVIQHNFRGRAKNNFALTHEYMIWAVPKNIDSITKLDEISSDIKRNLRRTGQGSKRTDSPTLFFGIEVDVKTLKILSVTKPIFDDNFPKSKNKNTEYVFPIDRDGTERRWYYSPHTVLKEITAGNVYAKKINERLEIHYFKPGHAKRRKSVWTDTKYDSSTYGSELLTQIIGENNFPFPKSIHAVKDCIKSMTNKKNAIILDFFAGSGTVGQAVLELNKEDGGNRQFILCTNNEGNICESVTYPRIKNIINGYDFNGKHVDILIKKRLSYRELKSLHDEFENIKKSKHNKYDDFNITFKNNFIQLSGIKKIKSKTERYDVNLKYFKTDFIDAEPLDKNKKKLVDRCIEMLCLKECCFNNIKQTKIYSIFKNYDEKYLGIVYDDDGIAPLIKQIKIINKNFNIYVFTLDNNIREEEFSDVIDMISLKPIPEVIMNVYSGIIR